MGALALNKAEHPDSIQLWSDRLTKASSELYGTPDPDLAREMFEKQQRGEVEAPFEATARLVGEYMQTKYNDVYEALGLSDAPEEIPPSILAERFEAGLRALQTKDPAWNDWAIELVEDSGSLGVNKSDKKVLIGARHAHIHPQQLKALFTHEVPVHGLRAVNGEKHHKLLKSGLPGYTNSEEGLGIFMEYAVTGVLPERNIDRYLDIAYALGQIDGKQHTRAELLELAMARAIRRNEFSPSPLSLEDIEKEVYSHVNRIYRGSQGNEYVGIFTRDIAYHVGFMSIGAYITKQLESGTSFEALMEFILLGKFDPTNEAHVEFVREHAMS